LKHSTKEASVLEEDARHVVHPHVEHVYGPEEVSYGREELVVLCLVRDGRPYLRSFVEHYTSMGAKHLVFLDNGSIDGTAEILKEYGNVTVLRTTLPFNSENEKLMRRYLVRRFGRERWSLCVDIDELFDYPYSDVIGLGSLLGYLNHKSYTAVVAQMLDMFPEEPLSSRNSNQDEPLKERHRFYDISDLERMAIKEHPRCPADNTYGSDEIEAFRGGIRSTLFGAATLLTKHPLVVTDGEVRPIDPGPHWAGNARVADITCVLYHYKFLDGHFHKQTAQAVREEQHHKKSDSYKKYLRVLEETPSLLIRGETAREMKSVNDLVDNGFLVVSEEYMMLAYDRQRERAGHHALGGVPGKERDEAFDRARARAKVQSLRAQRFQREVEALREENRRLLEEKQSQIEDLKSRLSKQREKSQSQIEDLKSRLSRQQERSQSQIEDLRSRLARQRQRNQELTRRIQNIQIPE
jgi:hypothetical protein